MFDYHSLEASTVNVASHRWVGGDTQIILLTGCAALGLKPLFIVRIFPPQRTVDLTAFLKLVKIRTHF